MNIRTLLMLVTMLNIGSLYSSDNLIAARGGGGDFRGGGEMRGADFRGDDQRFRGNDENKGARDAAAMGAAHRSGEQEGYNAAEAGEGYYAPPPEYFPCGGTNQNQTQGN